jgi:hypothetical protein
VNSAQRKGGSQQKQSKQKTKSTTNSPNILEVFFYTVFYSRRKTSA